VESNRYLERAAAGPPRGGSSGPRSITSATPAPPTDLTAVTSRAALRRQLRGSQSRTAAFNHHRGALHEPTAAHRTECSPSSRNRPIHRHALRQQVLSLLPRLIWTIHLGGRERRGRRSEHPTTCALLRLAVLTGIFDSYPLAAAGRSQFRLACTRWFLSRLFAPTTDDRVPNYRVYPIITTGGQRLRPRSSCVSLSRTPCEGGSSR